MPDLSVLRVFVLDYNGHGNLIMIEICMLKMLQKTQNTKIYAKISIALFKKIKITKNTDIIGMLSKHHNDVHTHFENMCSTSVHRCDD